MLTKKYGIYSTDGKKLKNSDELLRSKERFWHPITEKVMDTIPHNVFGILLHKMYINGKVHWIVRESARCDVCTLKIAKLWMRECG